MRRFKRNYKEYLKVLLSFVVGIFLALGIGYAATIFFNSNVVSYDNSNSDLTSTDVQGALDELYNKCHDAATTCPDGVYCENSFEDKFPGYTKINQLCTTSTDETTEPYINTGLKYSNGCGNNTDCFYGFYTEFTIKSFTTLNANSKDKVIFGGGGPEWTTSGFYLDYNFSSTPYIYLRNNSSEYSGSTVPANPQSIESGKRYAIYYRYNSGKGNNDLWIFSTRRETLTEVAPFGTDHTTFIFAYNQTGTPRWTSHICMHKVYFSNNSGPVKMFTPCKRNSDGKLGMCEEVNGEFYVSPGNRNFSIVG